MRFADFIYIKESTERPLRNDLTLGKNNDFKPFTVDKNHHSNLRELIHAFNNSGNVEIRTHKGDVLTTTKKDGTQETKKLNKKSLYLVGGAVRDHLLSKTPKDLDLATDATVPEIKMILDNAGFTEVKAQTGKHAPKNQNNLPETSSSRKIYYSKGWDRQGNEFVIGVKINGEEFEVATFRKDSKTGDGRTPDKMEPGTLEDDALRRDLTINSMYVKLDNPDGHNNKLTDIWGGSRHLVNKDVKFVGNIDERLEEDQLRALRYIRFVARFGNTQSIPDEYKNSIKKLAEDGLKSISPERVRDEFLKGLEHNDVDPQEYIRLYKELGLLRIVFPGINFKLDAPEDFLSEKEKHLAVAWILRDKSNSNDEIEQILRAAKWENSEIKRILFLRDIMNFNPNLDAEELNKYYKGYVNSGLSSKTLKKWWEINKKPDTHIGAFLKFADSPRVQTMYNDTPTDEFADLINPVTKQPYALAGPEIGKRKKDLEFKTFQNILQSGS